MNTKQNSKLENRGIKKKREILRIGEKKPDVEYRYGVKKNHCIVEDCIIKIIIIIVIIANVYIVFILHIITRSILIFRHILQ